MKKTSECLYESIMQDPDDDHLRMIYADALQDEQDTEAAKLKAEFIRVQVELAAIPEFLSLREISEQIIKERKWGRLEQGMRTEEKMRQVYVEAHRRFVEVDERQKYLRYQQYLLWPAVYNQFAAPKLIVSVSQYTVLWTDHVGATVRRGFIDTVRVGHYMTAHQQEIVKKTIQTNPVRKVDVSLLLRNNRQYGTYIDTQVFTRALRRSFQRATLKDSLSFTGSGHIVCGEPQDLQSFASQTIINWTRKEKNGP